jgi:hypothetical protein
MMIDVGPVVELRFAQLGDRSEGAAPTRFDAQCLEAVHEPRTIVGTHLADRDARSVTKFETGLHEGLDRVEQSGVSRAVSASSDLRLGQRARDRSVRVAVERHANMAAGDLDIARVWDQARLPSHHAVALGIYARKADRDRHGAGECL